MKIKIRNDEIRYYLDVPEAKFDTYISPLINLANTFAKGTIPKVVGQMSDLIQEFDGTTISEWEEWYLSKNPRAIQNATDKIINKIEEFKHIINKIDKNTIEKWVKDLVIFKTFMGLKSQGAIIKKVAELKAKTYRFSNREEESKGIDGFIGNTPVSIKPKTYQLKGSLPEVINITIIYYEKTKDGIEIEFS
ncbi:MAG: MjaI family restriction endonuclease [Thermodesulfobacteriota bacterium]